MWNYSQNEIGLPAEITLHINIDLNELYQSQCQPTGVGDTYNRMYLLFVISIKIVQIQKEYIFSLYDNQ